MISLAGQTLYNVWQGFIERGGGGGWHWDYHPPGKVPPPQVLKKYSRANGMQVADFMWMKVLSIEYMIQLRFAILEKTPPPRQKSCMKPCLVILATFFVCHWNSII